MKISCTLALLCLALLASSCGGSSGGSGVSAQVGEAAYEKAYKDAWVGACKKAVVDIHRHDSSSRAGHVLCRRPKGQQEGNLSFDPQTAREQGREEGTYDGCAYAWDEAYANSGADVMPRC